MRAQPNSKRYSLWKGSKVLPWFSDSIGCCPWSLNRLQTDRTYYPEHFGWGLNPLTTTLSHPVGPAAINYHIVIIIIN